MKQLSHVVGSAVGVRDRLGELQAFRTSSILCLIHLLSLWELSPLEIPAPGRKHPSSKPPCWLSSGSFSFSRLFMCPQELSSLYHAEENPALPGILIKKKNLQGSLGWWYQLFTWQLSHQMDEELGFLSVWAWVKLDTAINVPFLLLLPAGLSWGAWPCRISWPYRIARETWPPGTSRTCR